MQTRIIDGIALSDGELAPEGSASFAGWHKVAIEGEWSGHWMGPFSLNAQIFDQAVEYFKGRQIDTVVDYEHQSLFGMGQSPAAGWISDLQARTNNEQHELWARIDWTKHAAEMIRAKEYRYLSPTIVFNTRDRKSGAITGASLHSLALTNTPFLTELPEVRLNSLRAMFNENTEEQESMEELKTLADLLGVEAALETMKTKIIELQNPAKNAEETNALKARIAELENAAKETEVAALIDTAKREGKVTALNEEWAKGYAKLDSAGFQTWLKTATPIVQLNEQKKIPNQQTSALSEGQRIVCRAFGLKQETLSKFIESKGV